MKEMHFQDLYVEIHPATLCQGHGFLFFHGFPGEGERNADLAETVHGCTGSHAFVVHYGGLGKGRGKFRFRSAIEQSLELARFLVAEFELESLSIFGHSWGGLVALNVAAAMGAKVGKLILASPVSFLVPKTELRALLSPFLEADAGLSRVFSIEESIEDADYIEDNYCPRRAVSRLVLEPGAALLVQARDDETIPAEISRSLIPLFPVRPDYREVEQDHRFTNRPALRSLLREWLSEGSGCDDVTLPCDWQGAGTQRALPGEARELSELALCSKGSWGYPMEFLERCREDLTLSEEYVESQEVHVCRDPGSGIIRGFYGLHLVRDEEPRLEFLYVHPTCRGQGLGRFLFLAACRKAEELGVEALTFEADPHAASFYERQGAIVVGKKESSVQKGRFLPVFRVSCHRS